ncbi:MAG: glutamate--tRNA ligase [Endozoicomonadaceae bacterium]|nr:glutamate--tRNA ligase [Endozoicomonadaceae bacterium]
MPVRTRIAPSPTGDPHVGTAYIALFNQVFAHSQNGVFVLRIEDTDQQRSTPASEEAILSSFKWLGLQWDEGPDKTGPYGPYRQSERLPLYQKYAKQLIKNQQAFYCFCSTERLNQLRKKKISDKKTPGYDGHCLQLTTSQVTEYLSANTAYVIRMKVPQEGVCEIQDMLRGTITIPWQQIDMQILLKSDGWPTYHLANVVDDYCMKITHVIRGEEWINSAPKHQLLYQYFNWTMPILCHMPLLRNPDKSKLSKRKNPTSINYYRDMGYLPEAMINYLARMGWSMPDEQEQFTLQTMQTHFNIKRISLGGPIFDQEKLAWLNGLWIRNSLTDAQFKARLLEWLLQINDYDTLLPLLKSRIHTFRDIAAQTVFLFSDAPELNISDFESLMTSLDITKQYLQFILWRLEATDVWESDCLFLTLKTLASQLNIKINQLMPMIFITICGSLKSWSIVDSMVLLGPNITRTRFKKAIDLLGGISKKQVKTYEKIYHHLADISTNT